MYLPYQLPVALPGSISEICNLFTQLDKMAFWPLATLQAVVVWEVVAVVGVVGGVKVHPETDAAENQEADEGEGGDVFTGVRRLPFPNQSPDHFNY